MEPIRRDEIRDLTAYERMRPEFRKRIISLRKERRITAGDRISIVFENRETVLYQIQEMLRAERIVDETAILHELETYNEILPKPHSLAGTLFIELTESERIREELEEFLGFDRGEHLWFDLGPAGRAVGRFSEGQSEEGRISSVQYVQFPIKADGIAVFRDPSQPVSLVVDHPSYRQRVAVEGATRRSLAEDLG